MFVFDRPGSGVPRLPSPCSVQSCGIKNASKAAILSRFMPWDISHISRSAIFRISVGFHWHWWALGRFRARDLRRFRTRDLGRFWVWDLGRFRVWDVGRFWARDLKSRLILIFKFIQRIKFHFTTQLFNKINSNTHII